MEKKENFGNKLYKNAWFNMVAVMLTAMFSAGNPAIGLSMSFAYFCGWIIFAANTNRVF